MVSAEEFEVVAEIYDSIRVLYTKLHPSNDSKLAKDFDKKLKNVMEELSQTVNNPSLNQFYKMEKSLKSKTELYNMCSEKISFYFKDLKTPSLLASIDTRSMFKILNAVFNGYQQIINKII